MQKLVMIGHLVGNPEKVQGQDLCKFSLAVKKNYKNSKGEYETQFFNCVVWNKLHEICMKYLVKGSKILIVGELENRSYEKDGVKRYMTEVVVREMEMLSTKKTEQKITAEPIEDDFFI